MTLDKSKSMVTPPDEVKRLKGVNYFQPRPQPWFLEGTPGINSGEDVSLFLCIKLKNVILVLINVVEIKI